MQKILYLGPNGSYTQTSMYKAINLLSLYDYTPECCFTINDIIRELDEN